MKKILKNTFFILVAVLFSGIATTSCNNGDPTPDAAIMFDIATFESNSDNGAVFTLRQNDDSPLVTLQFARRLSDEYKVGQRYLIAYATISGKPYESGQAELYGIGYVYNSAVVTGSAENYDRWKTTEQNMLSLWRTGTWINIESICTYNKNYPATYELVVDETTLENDYPVAHLIYQPTMSPEATSKEFYATFDIAPVWNLENIKGIRVLVSTNTGMKDIRMEKEQ